MRRLATHAAYVVVIAALVVASGYGYLGRLEASVAGAGRRAAHLVSLARTIQRDLIPRHGYRCCMTRPCITCIAETPAHGPGPTCDCLSDVVNGRAPCGECVGGILAGRGNPYLVDYFPDAAAATIEPS